MSLSRVITLNVTLVLLSYYMVTFLAQNNTFNELSFSAIDVASGIYGYQIDKLVNQVIKAGNHPRASSIKRDSGFMPDSESI